MLLPVHNQTIPWNINTIYTVDLYGYEAKPSHKMVLFFWVSVWILWTQPLEMIVGSKQRQLTDAERVVDSWMASTNSGRSWVKQIGLRRCRFKWLVLETIFWVAGGNFETRNLAKWWNDPIWRDYFSDGLKLCIYRIYCFSFSLENQKKLQ